MATIADSLSGLIPLAFLPSGGQWLIIALIGVLLFAKPLGQVARNSCKELGEADSRASIHRLGVFLAFCLFAIGCLAGIVELASGHSASSQTSFMAAAIALGLALLLARSSGPD